jgi:CPA2 family monovalent cation:H+ antiporter-2
MHAQIPLLTTLVMAFLFAFALGFIATRLSISPIVGYLAAGILVGPHTPGFVADASIAAQLAEIGVILLMFGVGLQFSLRDLLAVRWIAVSGALTQMTLVVAIVAALAWAWGWGVHAGLVLGLALSVASTIVMLRVFDQLKALRTPHGRIAVGWLLVEDIAMVVALVLLPAAAAIDGATSDAAERAATVKLGEAVLLALGKVVVLAGVMLVIGRRVVPWFLAHVARAGSRELFTLAVLAAALGIAYGSAELFSVSFALGAFLAGIVLSESDLSHQAAANSLPFRDAFAVLFFVSIGMLFDPAIVLRQPLPLVAIVLVVMALRPLIAAAVVIGFRYPITTALFVATSRAQIGEFSFILAGMGLALGLLPPEAPSLILAAALISIAVNPLLFRAIPACERRLNGVPRIARLLGRMDRAGAAEEARRIEDDFDEHAIIVGGGRVGSLIADAFDQHGIPFVMVEEDRRLVDRLRAAKVRAIFGNGAAPGILEAAGVARARLLVAAVPDGFVAGQILARAREVNSSIKTVARAHDAAEVAYLKRVGAGLVLMGEHELALGMAEYALRGMDAAPDDVLETVQRLKTRD